MSIMRTCLTILSSVGLLTLAYFTVSSLNALAQTDAGLIQAIELSYGASSYETKALQNILEERLGDLERRVEELEMRR